MEFKLLNIKNDIKWHLEQVIIDYPPIEKVDLEIKEKEKEIRLKVKFSEVFVINEQALMDELKEDYFMFLNKHHPEVKENMIKVCK